MHFLIGVPFVVLVKERATHSGIVKLRNIAKKTETDVYRNNLIETLLIALKKSDKIMNSDPLQTPMPQTAPSLNTYIISSERNSKQRRQIERQTIQKILPVIKSFVSSSGVKVVSIALPFSVIKDIPSAYTMESFAFMYTKHNRYKQVLQELANWLNTCKACPVFIYSFKEDQYVIVITQP